MSYQVCNLSSYNLQGLLSNDAFLILISYDWCFNFYLDSQTLQYSSIQVDSVHKQGYQVAFLASKTGDGDNEILSLHGGLTLNIQKQLEVNFKQLLTGKLQTSYYSLCLLNGLH